MHSFNRHKVWFTVLLLLVLGAGCCDVHTNGVTAPTVSSVTPLLGLTSTCSSTTVTATFSAAMLPSSVNATSFTLTGPGAAAVAGLISYDASTNTASFTPSALLALSTLYTATITTGALDSYGIALATSFSWTFTTAATACTPPPPVVTSVDAPTVLAGSCPNATVVATFDEAMNASTINATTFTVTPGVSGTVTADGTNKIFTFTPTTALTAGQTYTATITTGAQDPAGHTLASNFVLAFTIAANGCNPPPAVSSVSPPNLSVAICPNSIVSAIFDEAMAPASINDTTFTLTGAGGAAVAGQVSYGASTNSAIFTPSSSLALNTTYTATITTGVMDLFGNALAANYVWTFTTGGQSCLAPAPPVSVAPSVSAVGVCSSAVVTATFGQAMDPTTLTATTFTVTGPNLVPVVGQITHDVTDKIFTFAPSSTLSLATTYTVTITTGAKDALGNALASDFVYEFTTSGSPCTQATLPTVIAVTPTAGAIGVCEDTVMFATFSKAMNAATINTATFTLTPDVTGTVSLDATGKVATFTPSANLALSTAYRATITTGAEDTMGNALVGDFFWDTTTASMICQPPVPLASAANFEVLAGTAVSNNGATIIGGGNLGSSPGSAITGFPPGIVNAPAIVDDNDPVAAQAQFDLTFAYNYVTALSGGTALPAEMSGLSLTPGLYQSSAAITLSSGVLTLNGENQPNPVFIFQLANSLLTSADTQIVLTNGAQAKNVYWQIGTSATLGANSIFAGTIMALQSITLDAGAALQGRALSRNAAVTLDSNIVAAP